MAKTLSAEDTSRGTQHIAKYTFRNVLQNVIHLLVLSISLSLSPSHAPCVSLSLSVSPSLYLSLRLGTPINLSRFKRRL